MSWDDPIGCDSRLTGNPPNVTAYPPALGTEKPTGSRWARITVIPTISLSGRPEAPGTAQTRFHFSDHAGLPFSSRTGIFLVPASMMASPITEEISAQKFPAGRIQIKGVVSRSRLSANRLTPYSSMYHA